MKEEGRTGSSVVIAAMIAASLGIFLIGLLNLIGELSDGFKDFLILYSGMGPLSGKVIIAYAAGAAAFFFLFKWKALARQNLWVWTGVLLTSTAVSWLLVTHPFIELLTE